MNKKNIVLFLFLFVHMCFSYAQQIITDNTQQPNQLIQNLVGSDCASVSNVSSSINGSVNNIISYGTFDRGTSDFPLQNGIVLSTGRVSSAGNMFNSQDLNEGELDWTTDSDILDVLGIDQTLNATSVEFDFTSANNFVAFKYLFASDEYQQEYPCTFQDVFAVLIKRAGSADPYVNIALVPETTNAISTNTIHPNITGFCEAQNEAYFQGYNLGNTNFNGSTTVLTAISNITPNETYHIKFVIADHIDERFDSAVFIEAEGFGNSIDLGPDQSICGNDLTLDANINNATAVYSWYLNGNLIVGENNPTLEVNQSGTYSVDIAIPSTTGNCTVGDTIDIEIIPFQEAAPITDFSVCDPAPSDGLYNFDFTLKNDEIYNNLPSTNYTITYHFSLDEAQNNINAITSIYQNTEETETIFVRIESLSGDCLQIGSFDINVNTSPNTLELGLYVCNDIIFSPDFTIGNLSSLDFPVSNYEFNTTVSYYLTEEDATNANNPLTELPDVSNEPSSFFARVEDDFNSCPSIVTINLSYVDQPDLGFERFVFSQCVDPDYYEATNNGTDDYNSVSQTYDIDAAFADIESQFPGIWVQLNVIIGGNPRLVTTNALNFSLPISLRFDGENCATRMTIEFHKNILYNLLREEQTITRCDDPSNDGIVDIDLVEIANQLKDGYLIDLIFYETEADRDTGTNPLDQNTPFSVTDLQSLFIVANTDDCTHHSKVTFNIEPALNLSPVSVNYCGNADPNTNNTNIALEPLKEDVLNGLGIVGLVNFYLSQEDAENETNALSESYNIPGNQQEFFVRVINIFTGCSDITTLQVNVSNTIEAGDPNPIIICDTDQDGTATVNLESVIPELSNGATNLDFTFFETYENAVDNENAISNPSNYTTASKNIYIRAEIASLDCFTVFTLEVSINPDPQLNGISDFILCTIDTNNSTGFFFENKDLEVINEQPNMQVLYFESAVDAINKTNPIDKTIPYFGSSNPQIIYVRLENEAENSCYKIAPMQIEVRQAPIYTEPSDVFECDVNNTGLVTTDLNEKINEITNGSTQDLSVTFHLTPLNANIGSNEVPLNFTTNSSQQLLFARVVNNTSGCFEVSTFYVNALSLPEVNYEQSFTSCANSLNTNLQWDLTLKEIEILNGRQYNVDFTYYRSEADLESNINPISNPESYTNLANPETVFVKVRNASTNCYTSVPLELVINMPPPINMFETYSICENQESHVDLLDVNEILLDDTYNIVVSFYTNAEDAEANENPLNTDYNYTNTLETLYIRAEYNTTHCYIVYPFQLVVNPPPNINQPEDLVVCDDDFDGNAIFDLALQNSIVLNEQNPDDFSVSYFNSEIDAIENNGSLNTTYLAYNSEIVYLRVENSNTGCFTIAQFVLRVIPLPFNSLEDQVICLNNLPLVVSATTSNPNDTYLWSTNATTSEIEIFETGTYSVTITNQFGCENTKTFSVTESESATIDIVETIDFSDPNNITVSVNGIGNYLYQLNSGTFQESNTFENVPIGYNTITIIDQNGCAQVTREVLVIDAPKHISPNNDGDFDTWHIVGVDTLPGTIIHIFDRYGKLIKELGHNTLGWDGTYNGNKMPSGDYWYVATVFKNGEQFKVKGHFALKY